MPFDSYQGILDYLQSETYGSEETPLVCFGFYIDEKGPADYEVRLTYNDAYQDRNGQAIPSQ